MYSTQVLGLPGGGFVTASANKEIHFYDASRKLIKRVQNAHGHVVKKLAYLAAGDLIYSAGNDGYIKSWTRRGDAVGSWQAHFSGSTDKGKEYDPFIFALCTHTNAAGQPEVVTGGEDAHVRIWTPQGQLIQVRSVLHISLFSFS
jgi:WD40 repeat protein